MTCVVGIRTNNGIFIAADVQGTGGHSKAMRVDGKVFEKGEFIYGGCGSYRMIQVLRYVFKEPAHPEGMGVMAYLVSVYTPALVECFKEQGILHRRDDVISAGTYLMGYRGTLFKAESDLQWGENECCYDACGSGDDLARGCMFALIDNNHMSPEDKLYKCLDAASAFNATVGGRYELVSVKH